MAPIEKTTEETKTDISRRIREYALDLGYTQVGFAPTDDFREFLEAVDEASAYYDWWINSPRKPIEWARPTQMAPGSKSIVVLVYDFAQRYFPPELSALMGRVYQSRSYLAPPTNINGARLELIKEFLEGLGLTVTEATWIPQRWAAYRAGLTSFGKNTFAYSPKAGSFIVISTLLVDAELEFGKPGPLHGCPDDCTRCLDACPTGALYEPYHLNPQRCLAFNAWMPMVDYVPHEIRSAAGLRIHGCDACQEACPRNLASLKRNDERPHDGLLDLLAKELTLDKVLHLSPAYYDERVRPVMYNYIKNLDLFRRNAAIAIGNSHDPRYIPDLAAELKNPSPLVRAHVAWALGQIGSEAAAALLNDQAATEDDPEVLKELQQALEQVGL